MSQAQPRVAVIICSVGRPDSLRAQRAHLTRQSRPPDRVVFVVSSDTDIDFDPSDAFPAPTVAETLVAPKGLPRQRNAGLDRVQDDCDIVVFYDDDFVPADYSLDGIVRAFDAWPDVNGMTGLVLADGIRNAGLSAEAAAERVAAHERSPRTEPRILREGLDGLYGCNMAYRMSAVGTTRFDEALPLYGWLEDLDFAFRIPGRRIRTDAFAGVHRGAKSGRETAGRRLGYSQIANPWYLWRKGTVSARTGGLLAWRNMTANHLKLFAPEPWIDRRARAAGNWLALMDILRGRAHPGRILEF